VALLGTVWQVSFCLFFMVIQASRSTKRRSDGGLESTPKSRSGRRSRRFKSCHPDQLKQAVSRYRHIDLTSRKCLVSAPNALAPRLYQWGSPAERFRTHCPLRIPRHAGPPFHSKPGRVRGDRTTSYRDLFRAMPGRSTVAQARLSVRKIREVARHRLRAPPPPKSRSHAGRILSSSGNSISALRIGATKRLLPLSLQRVRQSGPALIVGSCGLMQHEHRPTLA